MWLAPSRPQHDPEEIVFDHSLECQRLCLLCRREASIEIHIVLNLQVFDDQSGIRDRLVAIDDVGQLRFGANGGTESETR